MARVLVVLLVANAVLGAAAVFPPARLAVAALALGGLGHRGGLVSGVRFTMSGDGENIEKVDEEETT